MLVFVKWPGYQALYGHPLALIAAVRERPRGSNVLHTFLDDILERRRHRGGLEYGQEALERRVDPSDLVAPLRDEPA